MSDVPARIDPASLRSAQFQGSFRKYDSKAVDQYLAALADQIAELNRYVDSLEREVAAAARASAIVQPVAQRSEEPVADVEPPSLRTLSDDEIATLVGDETAFVLATARKAAEEIRTKAEESAARMIRESHDEAAKVVDAAQASVEGLRTEAEKARDVAVAKAEAEAVEITERAKADAERRTSEARAMADDELVRAERIRAETDAEAERVRSEAKDEGRSMVNEAMEARTRILEDLQRRRDLGRSQIARLVVGRDRLLETYAAVRSNVDEMTAELEHVLDDPFEHDPGLDEGFVGIVATAVSDIPAPHPSADEAEDETVEDEDEPVGDEPADEETVQEEDSLEDEEPVEDEAAEDETPEDQDAQGDDSDEGESDAEASDGEAEETTDVDDLFARLRANREASVERAQAVLSSSDPAAGTEETEEPGDAEEAHASTGEGDSLDAQYLASGDLYEHRSEILDAANKSLPRALKRLLADEQNEVLDALRRSESTDLAELLPDQEDHVSGYAAAASKVLVDVAVAAASTVDAKVTAVDVDALASGLADALVEPLRRRIERAATDVEGDHEELDERLRSLYREWKIDHIGKLASDALISAYSAGLVAAAPKGAKIRWLIDPATGPCPDCQDNALEGPIDVGSEFPTGDGRPQAHPGCSCVLAVEPKG